MSIVYLIRHAETRQTTGVPPAAWTLSDSGNRAAAALASAPFWPVVETLHASSEPKAIRTARLAAARRPDLAVRVWDGLVEVGRPAWVDEYEPVARWWLTGGAPAGWEPLEQVRRRIDAAMAAVTGEASGRHLVVVGHGLTSAIWIGHLIGVDPMVCWDRLSFAGVTTIDLAARAVRAWPSAGRRLPFDPTPT